MRRAGAQTVKRESSVKERPIQVAVVQYLRLVLPRALVLHIPNEAAGGDEGARVRMAKLKEEGVVAGASDILIIQDALVAFFEVKAPKGVVSADQSRFMADAQAAGAFCAVVRSIDDARAAVAAAGLSSRDVARLSNTSRAWELLTLAQSPQSDAEAALAASMAVLRDIQAVAALGRLCASGQASDAQWLALAKAAAALSIAEGSLP